MTTATAVKVPTTVEVLQEVRDHLAQPGIWAQGGWQDNGTTSENWNDPEGKGCTCLFLGLDRPLTRFLRDVDWTSDRSMEVWDLYSETLREVQALVMAEIGIDNIDAGYAWNDAEGRTLDEVLAVLDRAIAAAQEV